MKRYSPLLILLLFTVYLSTTGFQCGSAEVTTAKLAIQQQQWEKAEESLAKEVAKNPQNEEAWYMLGQVRWEQKKHKEANEAFEKALALSNTHQKEITNYRLSYWSLNINEGVQHYNNGRENPSEYDVAAQKFRNAISAMPDSANGHYYLALTQIARKDYAGAETSLLAAVERKAGYTDAIDRLGSVYLLRADEMEAAKNQAGANEALEKGARLYEKAHKDNPEKAEYTLALIDIYERLNQNEKSMALTSEAVAADPGNMTYRYVYGVFLLKREKFEEAVGQLERVTKSADIPAALLGDAVYNTGVAYLNWGVAMKAESDKKLEQEQKKGNRNAKGDETYKEKFRAALPFLEKATETRGDDVTLWQNIGRLYANLNMVEKSKLAYEKVDKLLKGN